MTDDDMQKLRALAAEWNLGPTGGCAEDVHMGCGAALDDLLDEIAGLPPKPSEPPDGPIDDSVTVVIHVEGCTCETRTQEQLDAADVCDACVRCFDLDAFLGRPKR